MHIGFRQDYCLCGCAQLGCIDFEQDPSGCILRAIVQEIYWIPDMRLPLVTDLEATASKLDGKAGFRTG